MSKTQFQVDQKAVKKALQAAARTYDNVGVVPKAIADRLLERLDFIRLNPLCVVDVGARTGYATQQLEERYREAIVAGLDLSVAILQAASSKMIAGEYTAFPFADQSVDLIFSNLAFQWSSDFQQTLQECHRVLKPGGLLLFSMVGPDTLKELRSSFADGHRHVHPFCDMHNIGDMLTQLRFTHPVMDMERLTVHYSSVSRLVKDLKQLGAQNASQDRLKGLMGKTQWRQILRNYENCREKNGALPATVEVIYGHAFGAESNLFETANGEVTVPIDKIIRRN
ncbi:malonyl-ACP O-methyltransferase BioC [Coxiella endosymbiont of Ornithodoros amblus]|uniref:malonyl-ACP O-methyltransferase BioC n=1 Tax=Coxiella endosymbiont of Ornithodoros amblus TaxID=1656166 RepID=UPI00244DB473|nr:malonyl-ACP O-methyltransferase BioC [Coxiella endosymbiont of Ornithodoros amblus]MBW5802599.1 malonyl-ACP O-methyltransferase BioC [Coxiella endosymbiont of Ornithodoros amblus]